ncbi:MULTISPECIES: Clp protease N-terminal domain-containing protein [unclassified Rhodococcus (in: high G+C Gram-positive bacteria)]|uniref:Clp protease N-terminal domain-containing protein n=1 Tax=unclassified Rhodococcus (in: high G+C Gram-positive bacteria) TaxID=192944 RepID=UPI00163B5DEA|nr:MULTISPECIES: Clp protease N-terminal domain-containing protein [unclassified Rhodococcus (in: high G+C Gram-positive bacteria)]MBC2640140.1 Clp protease N-terminal domain-containing protein [Rhodococcus sp. 3A]MBC2895114.1 Clp protease N-terminal domain-containing protein [Rhodococcus sp. 4CII]
MSVTRAWRDMRTMKTLFAETEAEADRLGDREPGLEHLLLGSFALPDGTAGRVFEQLGSSRDGLREAIVRVHGDALTAVGMGDSGAATSALSRPRTGPLRLTEPAQSAFRNAVALARSERRPIAGADVVAAVATITHGTAARALESLGLTRSAVVEAARAASAD